MVPTFPKITFGIIVLNGEPFTRYNLRALYPFAHEIIVAEGANPNSAAEAFEGHSIDGTLDVLRAFKAEEDPEDKLQIVTRDGFWSEKDEQSQAYAERATGDYLWQIDIDEFWKPEDINQIITWLRDDPEITQMNVEWQTFWGGFDYLVESLFLNEHLSDLKGVPRIFKWGEGYSYITHRPPTVVTTEGQDLRTLKWIDGPTLAKRGIYCYHYSFCFPQQVDHKMAYYGRQDWKGHNNLDEWAKSTFLSIDNPFQVYHIEDGASWLKPFQGTHPPQIQELVNDISTGTLEVIQRQVEDIEKVMNSRRYRIGSSLFDWCSPYLLRLRKRMPGLERRVEDILVRIFTPGSDTPTGRTE